MSLAAPYQEHYYVADGVTTSFAFGEDFTALSAANVKCIIYFQDGTNCIPVFTVNMPTGYINIVTLTKPDGTVLTVPPAESIVRVFRDTPEQQNVTASQLQNYTAKQLERIFDSVVAMIQEVSYSDLHKTIRLTETQRDVSMEQLKEENDQAILYWDFETKQLKATDYGQNQVVKSDTVDRLVYLQPEGKIYFIPKGSNNPIAIGSATIHNDLSGRNAPDCHPESAITNLTTHLQDLRDKDTEIEGKADEALTKSTIALQNSETALSNSEEALVSSQEAKSNSEQAVEYATQAQDAVASIKSERFVFYLNAGDSVLTFDESLENKTVDLYWNGQLLSESNYVIEDNTITLSFVTEDDDVIIVILSAIRQVVNVGNLDAHNINPTAHANVIAAHNTSLVSHANLMTAHNADLNAHAVLFAHIDCGEL